MVQGAPTFEDIPPSSTTILRARYWQHTTFASTTVSSTGAEARCCGRRRCARSSSPASSIHITTVIAWMPSCASRSCLFCPPPCHGGCGTGSGLRRTCQTGTGRSRGLNAVTGPVHGPSLPAFGKTFDHQSLRPSNCGENFGTNMGFPRFPPPAAYGRTNEAENDDLDNPEAFPEEKSPAGNRGRSFSSL
jgi:hypothetical protein